MDGGEGGQLQEGSSCVDTATHGPLQQAFLAIREALSVQLSGAGPGGMRVDAITAQEVRYRGVPEVNRV